MSINKGKGGGGRRGVRDVLISPFSKVFDHIREEFKLIDKVGKFRSVNLGKLRFEEGETMKEVLHNAWRNT
jgi:hypothetical protein